ncbi:MAG: cytochrome P450 [Pseudomonadota bacterium]
MPYLRRQMELGPIVQDRMGMVHTFSQAHLLRCLTSDDTRQIETDVLRLQGITEGPAFRMASNSMLFANDPEHRQRRAPLARAFAWKMIAELRPEIRAAADEVIAPHLGGPVEMLGEIAGPFPARVLARVIGLDAEDLPRFTRLVYSAIRCVSVARTAEYEESSADMGRLWAAIEALLNERRRAGGETFLSDYLARVESGDMTADEIVAQIVTLVLAGADTTRLALTAIFARLLQEPEAWAALTGDPEGLKAAVVEEGLRFDPIIGSLSRTVRTAHRVEGYQLPEGAILGAFVITATRDPAVYADPDRFDVGRADQPKLHPTFGFGPHRCLGEALARTELEEALAALATRAPAARLDGPPPTVRGLGAVRTIGRLAVSL